MFLIRATNQNSPNPIYILTNTLPPPPLPFPKPIPNVHKPLLYETDYKTSPKWTEAACSPFPGIIDHPTLKIIEEWEGEFVLRLGGLTVRYPQLPPLERGW